MGKEESGTGQGAMARLYGCFVRGVEGGEGSGGGMNGGEGGGEMRVGVSSSACGYE